MEECVFSGDDESQLTSVAFTPRSGEFEIDDFVVLEGESKAMFRPKATSFEIASYFFSRLLVVLYFFSFVASAAQAKGLWGSNGVAPAAAAPPPWGDSFYEAVASFPSLFIGLPITNFTLVLVPAFGAALSALMLLTGLACGYSFALLWILKLSCVALFTAVPKAMGDLLLLEVGFMGIFIFPPERFFSLGAPAAPTAVRWAMRLIAYRVVMLSGAYKLFKLKSIGILEILGSVPLPTFVNYYLAAIAARYAPIRAALTGALLFFEVVLSIFIVTPHRSCRIFGGLALGAYALLFSALGNFGPFYLLLSGCAMFCLDDQCLGKLAKWKFNALAKADEIVRKASVDAVDNIFAGPDEANGVNSATEAHDEANDEDANDNEYPETASTPLARWARMLSISPPVGGLATPTSRPENQSPAKYVFLANVGLWLSLAAMSILAIVLFVTPKFKGLAALAVFVAALFLHHYCEAAGPLGPVGLYSLFFLQAALVAEMLKNGPHTWSFLLWVAVVQLGLVAARRAGTLPNVLGQIVQAFVLLHCVIYGVRIVYTAMGEIVGQKAAPLRFAGGAPANHFYTANNYRSVWPIGPDRVELVIQGTDENPTLRTRWREYGFKRRPSMLGRFPALVPLYQWYLDEAMVATFNDGFWAPLASGAQGTLLWHDGTEGPKKLRFGDAYLIALLRRLLTGSRDVLGLLGHDPFGGRPPRFVRVLAYKYKFDFGPCGAEGNGGGASGSAKHWYRRELLGELVPPLSYAPQGPMGAVGAKAASNNAPPAAAARAAHRGANTSMLGRGPSSNGTSGTGDAPNGHVLHIVHTMPAVNQRTMALDLADSLNTKVPQVDGVLVTK